MTGKYTPGPWIASGSTIWKTDADGNEDEIADAWDHGRGEEQTQANAHLIAAAPDLLEAAISLVANLEEGDFISITRIDAMNTAIAKAEGRA